MNVTYFSFVIKIVRNRIQPAEMSISTMSALVYIRVNAWTKVGAISLLTHHKIKDRYEFTYS